jgi:alcohol dehydrogenase class IV
LQKHEQWQRRWQLADLKSAISGHCENSRADDSTPLGKIYLCTTASVRARMKTELSLSEIDSPESIRGDADSLVVAGGGSLIDRAKLFRKENWPALNLIAIPTIWGSGAEVSPIAVLNVSTTNNLKKDIYFSDDLIPDHHIVWPELAQSAPAALIRFACGDVWAHALEAFCSPLATDDIRRNAADLMNEIASYPLGFDSRWFDASAAACLLQARSSVGLIHGFAHVLEPLLRALDPAGDWGHAKLCSVFQFPVLSFNLSRSCKVRTLATAFGVDLEKALAVTKSLFDEGAYRAALSVASQHWDTIARDRCSRTNCILVRRDSLDYFQQFRASEPVA